MYEDMILPDDFTMPEEPGETEPASPQEGFEALGEGDGTSVEAAPEVQAELPKFRVKYNHEEKELGYDEAVPLIQKGMNYDKLQERFHSIQNDPRLNKYDKVQEISGLLGYQTDDELIEALFNTYYENAAARDGLTAEQVRKDAELAHREAELTRQKQIQTEEQARNAMYEKLVSAFPDIRPEAISPETWALARSGVDLTAAYIEQRNRELESQLKTLKQNERNAKAAPVGSVTEHGAAEIAEDDPFMRGFNSVI